MKNLSQNLSIYKSLRVLVTGSTGFKGSWLVTWLKKIDAKVYAVSLKPDNENILFKSLDLEKKINQSYININDFNKINNYIKKIKPDIIFHLAAQSIVLDSFYNPLETFNTNIIGSANILESVRLNKIPHLVYVTSDKCYLPSKQKIHFNEDDMLGGNDNYSASKASAEIIFNSYYQSYFKSNNLVHGSVRAGNVIGGGDFKKNRIIPDIIKSIYFNRKLSLRNPEQIRPWQHVLDPLFGYLLLGEKLLNKKLKGSKSPSWNFAPNSTKVYSVMTLTKKVLKLYNYSSKIKIKKNKFIKESKFLSINNKKAKKELNWSPKLSFNHAIELTVNWYKNFYNYKNPINNYDFTVNQIDEFESLK